jgi:hypothetical protein
MKHWKLTMILSILIALMTACGTQNPSQKQENDQSAVEPSTEQPADNTKQSEDNTKQSENNTEPSEDKSNGTDPNTPVSSPAKEDQKIRLLETVLTYEMEGTKQQKTGFLKESNNQGYSLYVMEGYQLEEEEPGRDVITYDANPKIYMLIEVFPDDANLSEVKGNTKSTLESGFDKVYEIPKATMKHELFKDAFIILGASSEDMKAESYIIKGNEKRPNLRITCYGVTEVESFSPFWAMANTIEQK